MTARRGRTDIHEQVSNFSLLMALIGFGLAGLFILIMLVSVLLLNTQVLPQSPILLGPNR